MSATSEFYLTQAESCAREAEAAVLDNVRDRCRRSEQSWRAMAEKLQRAETMRDRQAADKAARIEAEAEEAYDDDDAVPAVAHG